MDNIPTITIDKIPINHDDFIKQINDRLSNFLGKPYAQSTLDELRGIAEEVEAYNKAYDVNLRIYGYEQLEHDLIRFLEKK